MSAHFRSRAFLRYAGRSVWYACLGSACSLGGKTWENMGGGENRLHISCRAVRNLSPNSGHLLGVCSYAWSNSVSDHEKTRAHLCRRIIASYNRICFYCQLFAIAPGKFFSRARAHPPGFGRSRGKGKEWDFGQEGGNK